MAITNAQQYQQLVNPPMKGNKRPGYRGEAAAASDAAAGRSAGRDTSPAGTGNVGDDFDRGSFQAAQRMGEARQIAKNLAEDKEEEKLERFRKLGSNQRKVQSFLSKFSPIANIASKFGPLNTRDYFLQKVAPPGFSNLSLSKQNELFDAYLEARMNNEIDAAGNPIISGGEGITQILPVDTTFAQAPSTTEQEPEVEDPFKLARRFRAEGGIMNADVVGGEFDFESARQMYGLGKLVKKVTRTVKKIAKSPIGKAAIAAATIKFGGQGLAKIFPTTFGTTAKSPFLRAIGRGQFFGDTGILSAGKNLLFGTDAGIRSTPGLLDKFPGGGVGALITGTSIAAGLLTPEEETEAEDLARGEGIDIEAARNAILAARQDDFRARRFRAEGGSMKEPVAKKTMPLLDLDGKEMDLRAEGGFVPIGRMEKADDVPARLSKNEFVFTADAVRNAGDGNVDKGAEVMYNMMKNLEAGGEVSKESQGLEGARRMFQTSKRLEEVL